MRAKVSCFPLILVLLAVLTLAPVLTGLPGIAGGGDRPGPEASLYHYRAIVTRVIDGDTVEANIDLGMNTWLHGERLRLYRIDTPELRGKAREAGHAARRLLAELVLDRTVIIETVKDRKGKYGRYLAEIWLDGRNINDLMVERGLAVYRSY